MSEKKHSKEEVLELLKRGLLRTCRDIFSEYLELKVNETRDIETFGDIGGFDSAICSSITYNCGDFSGDIALIAEKGLSEHVVKSMGLEILSEEEEQELISDAVAELLNQITGNAGEFLLEHDIDFDIGVPEMTCVESVKFNTDGTTTWAWKNTTDKGAFCLTMNSIT